MGDVATDLRRGRGEAAQWFELLRGRSVSDNTLRDFNRWKRNAVNAAAFDDVETTWNRTMAIVHHKNRVARGVEAFRRKRPAGPWLVSSWHDLAIGMTLILGSLALGAAWTTGHPQATFDTRSGEQRLVTLSDGLRVRLNADSRLLVNDRNELNRLVLVKGEALVDAGSDPRRIVEIVAGPANIQASGGKVDVRLEGGGVRVSAVEGPAEIRAAHSDEVRRLSPGQQATVTKRGVSPPRSVDAAHATAWVSGRLIFQDTPLRAAVAEVNRYARGKIDLDADLSNAAINGVFEMGDTLGFVNAARADLNLKVVPEAGGRVRLSALTSPSPD